MARTKGMLNLSGNLEVNAQAPLDARTIVPTEADLTVASNFPYPYVGLEVYVTGTGKKFRLTNLDTTQSSSWHEIGEGGGGSGLPSGGTQGQYLVKQSSTEGDADWQTLSAFSGATSQSAGSAGLVPAPSAGDEGKVLFGNGAWGALPNIDLSNSSVESDILDTTEKAVGTTTDGYLIYQKVVSTGGSVPSGATLLMRVQLQNGTDIIRYTKTTDSPLPSDVKFAGVTSSGEVILKKHISGNISISTNDWHQESLANLASLNIDKYRGAYGVWTDSGNTYKNVGNGDNLYIFSPNYDATTKYLQAVCVGLKNETVSYDFDYYYTPAS